MQAGEKLNFIQVPDAFSEAVPAAPEKNSKDLIDGFIMLCVSLTGKFPEAIKTEKVENSEQDLEVFEMPLRIQAGDGSYLHVLVFGHAFPQGPIDFGINLVEHDPEGVFKGGYVYTYNYSGFMRQRLSPIQDEYDDPDRIHFSLINEYRVHKELEEIEESENIELRMKAIDVRQNLEEMSKFAEWELEMGFDGFEPTQEEIFHLAELLELAEPYTPPQD